MAALPRFVALLLIATLFLSAVLYCSHSSNGELRVEVCLSPLEWFPSRSSPRGSGSLGGSEGRASVGGRKVLVKLLRNGESREGENGNRRAMVAAPAVFLLFFGFLFPCIRSKERRERKQPVQDEVQPKHKKLEQLEVKIGSSGSGSGSFETSKYQSRYSGGSLGALPSPVRPSSPGRFAPSSRLSKVGSTQLTLNQIMKATQNFSKSHLIGVGVFGTVYKLELRDGQVVAIKRAKERRFNGPRSEFSNEVKLLSQIEHQNLVKLLGYIDEGKEQILICEYVPNGTLREHLDGSDGRALDFSQRLQIAIDVAHGLTYLHQYAEKTIIHRDVKSSNILLTEGLRAKVADFGFARAGIPEGQSHVVTDVKGTAGYMDPQYMITGKLTTKSDVFSFGVLLLELVSARRPLETGRSNEEKVTIRWAFKKYTHGQMREIIDPNLEEEVYGEVLSKLLGLAFECAAPVPAERPTMEQVVKRLWDIRKEYGRTRGG